ncbi:MAG: trypsin-like serine peptidase [Deltaproteobacteria bacterium]
MTDNCNESEDKETKARADSPMRVDDLIALDNRADSREPEELVALRNYASVYISAVKNCSNNYLAANSYEKPEIELARAGMSDFWQINLGREFVLGQVGEGAEAVERIREKTSERETFEPMLPKWSGITYHPKISAAPCVRTFRRRNGQRVSPEIVFGADDRQVYYPSGYPWRCIGRIFVWTNPSGSPAWTGSGALVGGNVVLTASHVCPWGSSPWMMQFVPASYDGVSLNGVSSYVQTYRGYKNHGQGDDMAILKLYTPLGNSLGYFGYKTYNDDWEDGNYWTRCGYALAVAGGQRPNHVSWFPITDDDNDGAGVELEYKADSSGGDSGGPVFGWWSGSPYVIGTHSGGEDNFGEPKQNVAAGGGALSSLIKWGRANW